MRFSSADLAITGLPVGIVDLNCRGVEFEKKRLNRVFPFARPLPISRISWWGGDGVKPSSRAFGATRWLCRPAI
jgi:hypothetical protein